MCRQDRFVRPQASKRCPPQAGDHPRVMCRAVVACVSQRKRACMANKEGTGGAAGLRPRR